jgi:methyl-accepting chemotaxis protein
MSVARRAVIAFAFVFLVSVAASAAVFSLASTASGNLGDYRARVAQLDSTMWALRSDFYNYDDQMNMYVAVLAGGNDQEGLAETTYQQAVVARSALGMHLDRADRLAPTPALRTLLARLRRDYMGYNGFADQTRAAAVAGDVKKAVYLSTVGNLEPSNDMMPTLDHASQTVTRLVAAALDALDAEQGDVRKVSILSAALIAAMILGLASGMQWMLFRPLIQLKSQMSRIASGDAGLSDRLPVQGDDEIAQLGLAFNAVLEVLSGKEQQIAITQAERERVLLQNVEHQRLAEQAVRTRAQTIIDETASSVAIDLAELSGQVQIVRQAANTIDERVTAADRATRGVVQQARDADRVVAELTTSLRQISGMAELIAGVADQTKLLALNATIEAARAGSAGRGFSVVANEVKDLAMTTAKSTSQITNTIAMLEQNTGEVASAIAAMSGGITGVDDATEVLRNVAQQQFELVDALELRVNETILRIDGMSSLTTRLERRGFRRVPASGPATLTLSGRTIRAELVDVGEGGVKVQFQVGDEVRSGETGTVEFRLREDSLSLAASVSARQIGDGDHTVGLAFLSPPPTVVQSIRAYVDDVTGAVTFF